MKTVACILLSLMTMLTPVFAQKSDIPRSIAESVGDTLQFAQQQFLAAA